MIRYDSVWWEDRAVDEIPVILDVDSLVKWFGERDRAVTEEEWHTASGRVGRNLSPELLYELNEVLGLVNDDVLGVAVCDAWEGAEFPMQYLDVETWLEWFDRCGYLVNGRPAERPAEPLILYRGATPDRARGMSWTDRRDKAEWFARRFSDGAEVWTSTFAPSDLLARIHAPGDGRGEHEYVVRPGVAIIGGAKTDK